jgi:hypothetical protein
MGVHALRTHDVSLHSATGELPAVTRQLVRPLAFTRLRKPERDAREPRLTGDLIGGACSRVDSR